ncbi:hypothetical protein [Streptomyces halobius]|uniref:Uncharacterized protein n=1 Tax=Streptomyces halobius TaxID=2879846 RepID=A0ABY4M483_9ACTN|nr:hypothetical protein [Streptomyces halobius]UQA91634.1 hypothetical protein K9S39_06965 [Streptomyces halobius]
MSEYDLGYYGDPGDSSASEEQQAQQQGPKWFRDYMANASKQMKSMEEELKALRSKDRQNALVEQFKAKGYAPGAATLYQGEPEQLDDWLKVHGDALAKLPSAPSEGGAGNGEEQPPQGPPASTVPAEGQEQMRLMQEAGTSGAAAPQGTEVELVNRLKQAGPDEFAKIMAANGNRYDWNR